MALNSATDFGVIAILAPVALAGTLTVSLTNGYTPAPGTFFPVLACTNYSGSFAGLTLPGSGWQADYTPLGLILRVSQSATDLVWTNTAGGNWNEAINWEPNQVPEAGERAFITNAGVYRVTASGHTSISNLTLGSSSAGAQTLLVPSGSALELTGDSSIRGNVLGGGGVLNLGGALALSGPLTNAGAINVTNSAIDLINNGDLDSRGGLVNLREGVVNLWGSGGIQHRFDRDYVVNLGQINKKAGLDAPCALNASTFSNSGGIAVEHGVLEVERVTLGPGSLTMWLNGPADVGRIDVKSPIHLAGTFAVNLAPEYLPEIGTWTTHLTYPSYSGQFALTNLPSPDWGAACFSTTFQVMVPITITPDLTLSLPSRPAVYQFPSYGQPFYLQGDSGPVEASLGLSSAGGTLRLQVIAANPAEDRLDVENHGEGPGDIGVTWNPGSPDDGMVRFGGREFATVQRRPGSAELRFDFESSANAAAIVALLQRISYTNHLFRADAFTDPSVHFPDRTVEFLLANGAGHHATLSRPITFPALLLDQMKLLPSELTLNLAIPYWTSIELWGTFTNSYPTNHPLRQWQAARWSCDRPSWVLGLDWDSRWPGEAHVFPMSRFPMGRTVCVVTADTGLGTLMANILIHEDAEGDCPFYYLFRYLTCAAFPWICTGGFAPMSLSPADEEPPSPLISLASYRALEALLKQSDGGRRLVGLYWEHGPEVLRIFQAQTNVMLQVGSVVTNFQPLVVALLSGRGERVQITQPMIDELNLAYRMMTNYASANLLLTLETERARFHDFQDFVGANFSQWAQMLEIPAPTNAWMHISSAGFTNGQFSVEANAVEGWNVSLWRASDLALQDWAPVPGLRIETNGYTLRLTATNPPPPRRFYQLRAQP